MAELDNLGKKEILDDTQWFDQLSNELKLKKIKIEDMILNGIKVSWNMSHGHIVSDKVDKLHSKIAFKNCTIISSSS